MSPTTPWLVWSRGVVRPRQSPPCSCPAIKANVHLHVVVLPCRFPAGKQVCPVQVCACAHILDSCLASYPGLTRAHILLAESEPSTLEVLEPRPKKNPPGPIPGPVSLVPRLTTHQSGIYLAGSVWDRECSRLYIASRNDPRHAGLVPRLPTYSEGETNFQLL